ncbi:reverse transcriptase [Plakobranchus ocellatus]|uniref:Reverse transcriptase n=1 Tax=Plakobranchus ocellatus TaxID=259542 RepID=A0AAV4BT88_9GAST|nr:reverse transcriptase [Plakobranchus ocellatus]
MPGCNVIKFADDTTVTGLILHNDESNFRKQIDVIVNWCSKNNLHLNVDKTKEIIVEIRRGETPHPPLLIHGATVERVPSFKFLGTHVSEKLTWDINLDNIVIKARQRLYFLRKLKSFDVGSDILINFHRATIESVLTLSITVWFGRASKASLGKLESIIRLAEKIINVASKTYLDDDMVPILHSLPSGRHAAEEDVESAFLLFTTYSPSYVRLQQRAFHADAERSCSAV